MIGERNQGREGAREKGRKEEREMNGEREGSTYLTHKPFKDIHFYQHVNLTIFLRKIGVLL